MQPLPEFARREHWTVWLSALATAFLVVVGSGLIITGTDEHTLAGRLYGLVSLLGGTALIVGIQGLRTGRLPRNPSRGLVAVGALVLGGLFWWFLFLPAAVGLAIIHFGLLRRGLEPAA